MSLYPVAATPLVFWATHFGKYVKFKIKYQFGYRQNYILDCSLASTIRRSDRTLNERNSASLLFSVSNITRMSEGNSPVLSTPSIPPSHSQTSASSTAVYPCLHNKSALSVAWTILLAADDPAASDKWLLWSNPRPWFFLTQGIDEVST